MTFTWGAANMAQAVARGVRWVHVIGTGVDRFPFEVVGDRAVTCSRGASAVPIAEWVLAMLLAFEKGCRDLDRRRPRAGGGWSSAGCTADLGPGRPRGIGAAVAVRALPFGMEVRAVRRSDAPSPVAGVELCDDLGRGCWRRRITSCWRCRRQRRRGT